jgi:hypothetical protein
MDSLRLSSNEINHKEHEGRILKAHAFGFKSFTREFVETADSQSTQPLRVPSCPLWLNPGFPTSLRQSLSLRPRPRAALPQEIAAR